MIKWRNSESLIVLNDLVIIEKGIGYHMICQNLKNVCESCRLSRGYIKFCIFCAMTPSTDFSKTLSK